MESNDRILLPGEAADMLGVSSKTLSRWAKAGKISSFRTLGGHRRYYLSVVNRIITNR